MSNSSRKADEAKRRARASIEISAEEAAELRAAAEADPDNPPLTTEDFARMKPAIGRPRGAVAKVPVTMRIDEDVVFALKAGGRGWQTRVNAVLREAMPAGFMIREGAGRLAQSVLSSGGATRPKGKGATKAPGQGAVHRTAASALREPGCGPKRPAGKDATTRPKKA
ncbi:BrnA antitoxin family protein [Hansschlegelia sp. KR7-227]|uniref:BrnA antitoxin family protein n=1 Tax=Hansschlegelia sp. KR7-227 TaxID=3400914 RepID=UPI003C0C0CA1